MDYQIVKIQKNQKSHYERVSLFRKFMRSVGLGEVPIVMAGGVWHLSDWEDWIDNPELRSYCFSIWY